MDLKNKFITLLLILGGFSMHAQVGINTTDPKSALDVRASNPANPNFNDGLLVPKVDQFPVVNPGADQNGMLLYLTVQQGTNLPGFYYWQDSTSSWIALLGSGNSGTLNSAYNFGGPGAGNNINANNGALRVGGTDGIVSTGTLNIGATMPTASGVNMIWNPRKASFRAGLVEGAQWSDANTGVLSTAFGYNTTASGIFSSAFGIRSVSSGEQSFASGYETNATNWCAVAFGSQSTASGPLSTAFGYSNVASGNHSTAFGISTAASQWAAVSFGQATQASGQMATAFGNNTIATGTNSTAFGSTTQSTGLNATAFGNQTHAIGTNSTAFGNDATASGWGSTAFGSLSSATQVLSTAFGNNSEASAFGATAFGQETTASGPLSTAFGSAANASAFGATAFGQLTTASGDMSTAFGNGTTASAFGATAFGQQTTASGGLSTAFGVGSVASANNTLSGGYFTSASGNESLAFGVHVNAPSFGETALGLFGTIYTPGSNSGWVNTDRIFSIGNGTGTAVRSDAFRILKNGLATLPSVTNALITAEPTGKAVVTKEWFNANKGVSLDAAYDNAGAGLGRVINADAGAVQINGNGGLRVAGNTGLAVTDPEARLDVSPEIRIRQNSGTTTLAEITTGGNGFGNMISQTTYTNYPTATTFAWQSFNAIQNATQCSIGLYLRNENMWNVTNRTITLYNGVGTGGTIIGSVGITVGAFVTSWYTVNFTFPMVSGQNYTIAINDAQGWHYNAGNVYGGGYANIGGDFAFTVDVLPEVVSNRPFRITGAANTPAQFNLPVSNSSILVNGRMGIGTTAPQAPLHVVGASGNGNAVNMTYFNSNSRLTTMNGWAGATCGYFEGNVMSTGSFVATASLAFSDERIKKVEGTSNGKSDLETLSKIEIVDYTMTDSLADGKNYKKVLAQQVEKLMPDAVTKTSGYLPSVYRQADEVSADGKWTTIKVASHNFIEGDKIKLISETKGEILTSVSKVVDSQTFVIDTSEAITGKIFVYGKQVDDLRAVDYDAIAMLNVSATQELYRLLIEANKKITELESANTSMQAEFSELKSDVAMLKELMAKNP